MTRYCLLFVVLVAKTIEVSGQIISYDCASFPESAGWTRRDVTFQSERWLDDGCFVQYTEMLQSPPGGQWYEREDWYDYSLARSAGTNEWFGQWRVATDGPSSAIPAVAPAFFGAGGFSGILYHVTIAEDQVRLIRDAAIPMVWADITPGVPHTYRLELHGAQSYAFYIDSELIDAGVPEGAYPTTDSFLTFGARAPGEPATTRWDYIRFGRIPQPSSGDYDSDGAVDHEDLVFFVDCLLGPAYDAAGPGCRWADMNEDGVANGSDISLFTQAMLR